VSQPLTAGLGRFVSTLVYEGIPAPAIATVKLGFTDCIGVMLAGSREPVTAAVERTLLTDAPSGPGTLYFSDRRTTAPVAAMINGTASHALDYDDVALKGSHPSTVLVPAILAEAQALGASGRDMIRAYVAGYEVWGELIFRERGNYQRKGWHPTGIFGALGAAAACAALRKLSPEAAAHALGIAASAASGVVSNMGAMVKPTHPGHAAACGMMAARYAANGVTAAHDALEHDQGFLRALSPAGDVDLDSPMTLPPARWRLLEHGLAIKKYPVCYRAHRAIDGMLDLLQREAVETAQIRSIGVTFSPTHALILKHHRPQTAIEGKFSIEFALACAILARRVGLRDLTDAFVRDPAVQELMTKVAIEIDPAEEPGTSGYAPADTVRLELTDGRALAGTPVRHALGDAARPLAAEDLWVKFEDCAGWSRLSLPARPLFDRLQALEDCASVDVLFSASRPVVPLRSGARRARGTSAGRRSVQ